MNYEHIYEKNADGAFEFDSTGEAYDATQCCEEIKDGDMLVIHSERVVGLAQTWPLAVTPAHGALHSKKETSTWLAVSDSTGIPLSKIGQAFTYADKLDYLKELP